MRRLFRCVYVLGLGLSITGSSARTGEPVVPAGGSGRAPNCLPRCVPVPYCPQPEPVVPPMPATPERPPTTERIPIPETTLAPESGPALGGEAVAVAPNMIGDFSGRFVTTKVTRHTVVRLSDPRAPNVAFLAPADFTALVRVPFESSGAFKIADNESPRPQDRLFLIYNFFGDILTGARPAGALPGDPAPTVAALSNFGIPTATGPLAANATQIFQAIQNFARAQPGLYDLYLQSVIREGRVIGFTNAPPQVQALANQISGQLTPSQLATLSAIRLPPNAFQIVSGDAFAGTTATSITLRESNVHQEVFGFEKTFLDGYASAGLRAPILQISGDGSLSSSSFGDLSIVLKYALLNDTMAGNVLSTGMVITVPTGRDMTLLDGNSLHPVLLQPYVGGILNRDRFYVHGFSSLAVPTDSRDAVWLFNDLGIGYRLYQNREGVILTGVIPTFETHVNTPLSHRGSQQPVVATLDEVILTFGVHLELIKQVQLSIGVATPVTGPLPFDVEAFAQLNWRF